MWYLYFRFYDLRMALAVTMAGQLSIRWIEKKLNEYMNKLLKTSEDYVIASDTDSVYITFDTLVEKFQPKNPVDFLDTIAKEKIEPFIDSSYKELAEYLNAYDQKMQMKLLHRTGMLGFQQTRHQGLKRCECRM
mgnify:CR=1 FL=1